MDINRVAYISTYKGYDIYTTKRGDVIGAVAVPVNNNSVRVFFTCWYEPATRLCTIRVDNFRELGDRERQDAVADIAPWLYRTYFQGYKPRAVSLDH